MALVTGGLYVTLLAVRPALEAVDPGGGRAHIEHGGAGGAAEVLRVPSLIQRPDTFLKQDDYDVFMLLRYHLTLRMNPLQAAQRGTNLFL